MTDTSIDASEFSNNTVLKASVLTKPVVDFHCPDRYVDIGHSELAYWKVGKGPNLVLVHGWPLHSATYRGILPHLSKHFTCHLFDLPGAGQTNTGPKAPYGIKAHSESLLKGIQQMGIEQYALLGHNSGGAIMQFVAAKDSENVVGLVLGNTETPGYHSRLLMAFLMVGKTPKLASFYLRCLRFKWLRHSNFGFGSCFNDRALVDAEFYDWFLEPLINSSQARQRQTTLLSNFNESDMRELVGIQKNIKVPVQLLWGDKDAFFLLRDAEKMMTRFQGETELHVFEGGKLFIHEEYPERFATKAIEFLI